MCLEKYLAHSSMYAIFIIYIFEILRVVRKQGTSTYNLPPTRILE